MADTPASVTDNRKQNLLMQGHNDDSSNYTEPMMIQVTIYSIEGIRRSDAEARKYTSRSQSCVSQKRNTPASTSRAPTTAIISLRGQVVKTLVPSAPLSFYKPQKAETSARGTAYWQENILGEEIRSKDDVPPPTFAITRNMRRQRFHREIRINQISQLLPERIDLVVGIARGKDISPLGVASVVVNGEEEGESVINIPIKSLTQNDKVLSKKARQKRGLVFEGDSYWYSLDFNAFLRIGICAIPRHNYIPRLLEIKNKTKSSSEKSEDDVFIELNDENSLIAHFKESEQIEATTPTIDKRDEYASGCDLMFCGAMGYWSGPAIRPPSHSSESKSTLENKILEARVFPLRAMSDVSASTARWRTRQDQKCDC